VSVDTVLGTANRIEAGVETLSSELVGDEQVEVLAVAADKSHKQEVLVNLTFDIFRYHAHDSVVLDARNS